MRSFQKIFTRVVLIAAGVVVAGCSAITGIPNVDRVTVTVSPSVVSVNQTAVAFGTAYNGSNAIRNPKRAVNFSSSDGTVATVNATSGAIVALKAGTTYIRGQSDGKSDSALLTVRVIPATSVIIGPSNPVFRVGATNALTATARDSANNTLAGRLITWTAVDPTVLTIDNNGIVTPLKVGTTQIIASAYNGPGAATTNDTVTATVTPTPVIAIQISPNNTNNNTPTIYVGQTLQFTAVLTDSLRQTVTRPITWSTSAQTILAINPTTGLATGIATTPFPVSVTATVDIVPNVNPLLTLAASVTVAVLTPADSVRLLNNVGAPITTVPTLTAGSTTAFTLVPIDVVGNALINRTFSVTSSNPAVFTVPATSSGPLQITAVAAGTATLTVQPLDVNGNPQGKKATFTITVQ